jgi:hypothetical protein
VTGHVDEGATRPMEVTRETRMRSPGSSVPGTWPFALGLPPVGDRRRVRDGSAAKGGLVFQHRGDAQGPVALERPL